MTPAGVADMSGHVPAIGGFCFQQVGLGRVGPSSADPSLNVDVQRDGIEPDIAFTGANDSVPWVVWYEKGAGTTGLADNEMVFAAKAEADGTAGAGGFHWHVIGNTGNGILNAANTCAASLSAEQACSLNSDPAKDAEDPRVAAGTMNPANATAPWVTWDETVGGVHQVFVSRFVATPTPHFQIVNGGNPISTAGVESTRPDITFSGNTPYVTWREETSTRHEGVRRAFRERGQPDVRARRIGRPADPDRPGGRARADLLVVHRHPVQHGRAGVPGRRARHPVLPVHERDQPSRVVRRRLPARRAGDRHGKRDHHLDGHAQRQREPAGSGGQGLVPVRAHHRLWSEHRGADAPGGQHTGCVQRAADRAGGRDDDPLPRGGHH